MPAAECRARLGRNLLLARKRAGMSQETVAIGAGLHRTEIGLLERGERVPKLLQGIAWEPAITSKGKFHVSAPETPETANS
jgi:transcriptional regulator with XRE-family HTH domain